MPVLDLSGVSWEEMNKLPKPTNRGLGLLFDSVDRIVIKKGGVYHGKAMRDDIVLTIDEPDAIRDIYAVLEIDETITGFHSMCLGDYAIELISNNQVQATIGFHHGESIRYDKWNGDAALAKTGEVLNLLAELGLKKPMEDWNEERLRAEERRTERGQWMDHAPASFRKHRNALLGSDGNYPPALIDDLELEFRDKNKLIIALLDIYGRTEHFWTGYPAYEAVPYELLQRFDVNEIIDAYLATNRNYKTRKGLGRLLCCHDFKKVRSQYMALITDEIIDELYRCFQVTSQLADLHEMGRLRENKRKSVPGL